MDSLKEKNPLEQRRQREQEHQAKYAAQRDKWISRYSYYYDCICKALSYIVEPNKRVLNVGCQSGLYLEAVQPCYGVGTDISQEMVKIASKKHPNLHFRCAFPEELNIEEKFDYIIVTSFSTMVDILGALKQLYACCEPHTRIIVLNYNELWKSILESAEKVGLRMKFLDPNWLSENDVKSFLHLCGFQALQVYNFTLLPLKIPLVSSFVNMFLGRLPGVCKLALNHIIVAKPYSEEKKDATVSVVIPCKNEGKNIEDAVVRMPEMGLHTEILFCDDKSTDNTAAEVRRMQQAYPERDIKLIHGPGICKADNVWTGFSASSGDILMILDGDLTVTPEELPYFYNAMIEGKGEFINGARMIYPMQKEAMGCSNFIGNKLFSMVFSFILNQRIKDTLCGTKVLWRRDWKRIQPYVGSWGPKDLWGDYDLLFGAARCHLHILDLPVHYQERVYGESKMTKLFKNGLNMLKICIHAAVKLRGGY